VVSIFAGRLAMAFRKELDRSSLPISLLRLTLVASTRLQDAGVQPLPQDAAVFGCLPGVVELFQSQSLTQFEHYVE